MHSNELLIATTNYTLSHSLFQWGKPHTRGTLVHLQWLAHAWWCSGAQGSGCMWNEPYRSALITYTYTSPMQLVQALYKYVGYLPFLLTCLLISSTHTEKGVNKWMNEVLWCSPVHVNNERFRLLSYGLLGDVSNKFSVLENLTICDKKWIILL